MQDTTLTEEMVTKGGKTLKSVENLNLWGLGLHDISLIKQLSNLKTAALSANNIETLKPFADCHNLEELFLRKNKIQDLDELCL